MVVKERASSVWKSVVLQFARGWRWLVPRRRVVFWAAGIGIAVVLLIGLASARGVLWQIGTGITVIIVAAGTWWLWWRLPKRVVESQRLKICDPKARADIEDNFRKTVGLALGGIAVLIGAGMAYYGTQQTLRVNEEQSDPPPEQLARIREVITANIGEAIEVHALRTRHAGRATFIDFHLVVPAKMGVELAHEICDRIEAALREAVAGATATIYVEPEGKACA